MFGRWYINSPVIATGLSRLLSHRNTKQQRQHSKHTHWGVLWHILRYYMTRTGKHPFWTECTCTWIHVTGLTAGFGTTAVKGGAMFKIRHIMATDLFLHNTHKRHTPVQFHDETRKHDLPNNHIRSRIVLQAEIVVSPTLHIYSPYLAPNKAPAPP